MRSLSVLLLFIFCNYAFAEPNNGFIMSFENWYKEINPTTSSLEIRSKSGGKFGVFSTVDHYDEDGDLFSVPEQLMITHKNFEQEFADKMEFLDQLKKDEMIAFWLLYHMYSEGDDDTNAQKNPWIKYIRLLPRHDDALSVIQMSDYEMQMFKGSVHYDTIKSLKNRAEATYGYLSDNLKGSVFEPLLQDPMNWKRVLSIVHTRKLDLVTDAGESLPALVPFFDSMNFKQNGHVYTWFSPSNILHIYESLPVQKDQEVYRDIGDYCTGEIFVKHNVVVNMTHPCLLLPVDVVNLNIDNNDELFALRKGLAKEHGFLKSRKFKIFSDSLTHELLASVELMFMKKEHFDPMSDEQQDMYSEQVRRQAYEYLYHYLSNRLKSYPKTLPKENMSDHIYAIIEEEKHIIKQFLETINTHIKIDRIEVQDKDEL